MFWGLIGLLLFFFSCKENVDTEIPSVTFRAFSPQPSAAEVCGEMEDQVFQLESGETLSFTALIEDNEGLSQYKIDIHQNFACHGHAEKTEDWSVLKIRDISGTSVEVTEELPVPVDVTAGNYHFDLKVVDAAGNERLFEEFFSIKILNASDYEPPVIESELPATNAFSIKKGESIRFKGELTDNYSLGEGGNGSLKLHYHEEASGNEVEAKEIELSESEGKSFLYDFEYSFPANVNAGTYTFELVATDGVRNVSQEIEFEVMLTD